MTTVLPQGLQFVASCQASTSKRCQFAVLVTRFYVTYPNLPSYLHYFHYPLSTIATEKPWPEWTQSQRGLNPVWKHTRDGKSGSKIVSQSKSIFRHGVYDCQYGWQEHDEDDGFPLQLKMFHVSGVFAVWPIDWHMIRHEYLVNFLINVSFSHLHLPCSCSLEETQSAPKNYPMNATDHSNPITYINPRCVVGQTSALMLPYHLLLDRKRGTQVRSVLAGIIRGNRWRGEMRFWLIWRRTVKSRHSVWFLNFR